MGYVYLTERILDFLKKKKRATPTEIAKSLGENRYTISATLHYLYKKQKVDKERVRRNVFYFLKK